MAESNGKKLPQKSGEPMHGIKSAILAALAVMITAAGIWYSRQPAASTPATWADIRAEARSGGYRLITTAELADLYGKAPGDLLLVDTRQEWEYRTGHIAGARNFPMEPTGWARWHRADELRSFLGPDKERFIVFY